MFNLRGFGLPGDNLCICVVSLFSGCAVKHKTDYNEIQFSVYGNPLPKQSYKHSKSGGYTPKRIKTWQNLVALRFKEAYPGFVPLSGIVECEIIFTRANRIKCDLDNLSKAVLDALNGLAWEDDKQITKLELTKRIDKEHPGIWVCVREVGAMEEIARRPVVYPLMDNRLE